VSRNSLAFFTALCALALVGWNLSRFRDAEATIRVDPHLEFLPDPVVGEALSLGHPATMAKLQWIDSVPYFLYQLEHRDDSVPGSDRRGGFERLYEYLIYLDPQFEPFYLHAAMSTGAIIGDHRLELAFYLKGIDALPHSTTLWRGAAACLTANFRLEERRPDLMAIFLKRWAEAEAEHGGDATRPWIWLQSMSKRQGQVPEQLAFWASQLQRLSTDSPRGQLLLELMREALVEYGRQRLQSLADRARAAGVELERIDQLLEPGLVLSVYGHPDRLSAAEPIAAVHEGDRLRFALRHDPYGYPWRLDEGEVTSIGQEAARQRRRTSAINNAVVYAAREQGRWPRSVAEARAWVADDYQMPEGMSFELVEGRLALQIAEDPERPWTVAELVAAGGESLSELAEPAEPAE